jgi:hypothetical protein
MRGCRSTDVPSGAGTVIDHERLPKGRRHPAEQDARNDIAGAARGEWDVNLDRPAGIIGVLRAGRMQYRCGEDYGSAERQK